MLDPPRNPSAIAFNGVPFEKVALVAFWQVGNSAMSFTLAPASVGLCGVTLLPVCAAGVPSVVQELPE